MTVTKDNNGERIELGGKVATMTHDAINALNIPEPTAIEVAQPTLPKKRGRPEKVSKDIFQEVWNKCETLDEVAETLGLPRTSVSVKASNMRKLGCTMKRMKKARKTSC